MVMFINCMLIHGHNPEDLLASVIALIPKNLWSSLNTSDNYSDISVCCSLCKAIDYVFIDKYYEHLKSSNLQFAFQAEHDTVMCISVVKLLVNRKMPAIVIHLLLDNYTRQNICTIWNGTKSHAFTALNGVHQGGVLSQLLLNAYFVEMIYKLEKCWFVCKNRAHLIGALAYADDVILLWPIRSGLQKMIHIFEQFGIDF